MSIKPLESIHAQAIEGSKTHLLNNTEDKTKELVEKYPEVLKAQDPAALPETLLLQEEVLQVLISTQEFKENMPLESVCTRWQSLIRPMQIEMINSQKIPLGKLFSSANAAIDYLVSSPSAKNLKYADFTGFDKEFTNSHLKALTKGCPNLEYLIIPKSSISDEGLKYLRHIPNLKSLNIAFCYSNRVFGNSIASDSLKYLSCVPGLQDLSIQGCGSLDRDSLKNLEFVKGLQHLDIGQGLGLEPDALKNLEFTPALESLIMQKDGSLSPDTLKYLKYVPGLRHLNVSKCSQLEPDALKNLEFTPALESLIMQDDDMEIEGDSLKYLECVPGLKYLSIQGCCFLDRDSLKNLEFVKGLQHLNVSECLQLEPDSIKNLEFTPDLQYLDVSKCLQLEPDSIKNLEFTPDLQYLNVSHSPVILKHLKLTSHLRILDISNNASYNDLDFLEFLPDLEELNMLFNYVNRQNVDAFKHTRKLRKIKLMLWKLDAFVDNLEKVPELQYVYLGGRGNMNRLDLDFRQISRLERHGVKIEGEWIDVRIMARKLADKEKKRKRFYQQQAVLIVACIALHFFT